MSIERVNPVKVASRLTLVLGVVVIPVCWFSVPLELCAARRCTLTLCVRSVWTPCQGHQINLCMAVYNQVQIELFEILLIGYLIVIVDTNF